MNTTTLRELSLLKSAISEEYSDYLKRIASTCMNEKRSFQVLNIYRAFCFVTENKKFSALEILNNSKSFIRHFELLIGFIYSLKTINLILKYDFCRELSTLFESISNDKLLKLDKPKFSTTKVSEFASYCLEKFTISNPSEKKLAYLNGWTVTSKEGKKVEVHLDEIYVKFGYDFSEILHSSIENYSKKQKTSSLKTAVKVLKSLFSGFTEVFREKYDKSIYEALEKNNVQIFFHKTYKVLFARSQASGFCPKAFHKKWASIVSIYIDCFIITGVFDAPLKPFIVPVWRKPESIAPTFSVGGEISENEKIRWFSKIPLRVKDEEAISTIKQRIDNDISFIKSVCIKKFKKFLATEERNIKLIKVGTIKPLSLKKEGLATHVPMGLKNLQNVLATFYFHGIDAKPNYLNFLGCHGSVKQLNTELNLPSVTTLSVLLTILVIEHPLITPAWLQKWELFDSRGNQIGFKQVGNQYIAVSHKPRKGSTNAQQEVVLTDLSKSVIEFLIRHTQLARDHLKGKNNPDWRKMILTATTAGSRSLANLNTALHSAHEFYSWLKEPSNCDSKVRITKIDANAISEIHSLRSIRRHRGLQIYLETRSMDAVAEALGHESKDVRLLSYYLPKPLIDFFNERWVRQFQSAILLEAMKDSEYCLEAVNMSFEDVKIFLENHGISEFPEFVTKHQPDHRSSFENTTDDFVSNQLTYTISTPVLQLLLAIKVIVEKSEHDTPFLEVVQHWYQSAVFILNTLDTGIHSADIKLMGMYDSAIKNQLDTNIIERVLRC